jgi:hypothetical protein
MSADWKDRIAGIKRIVLALGVMSLCIVMSLQNKAQKEAVDPSRVRTAAAQYDKCAASVRESSLGLFGCAVVLKPKVKTSSIRFLSADRDVDDARKKGRPLFHTPSKQ